MTIHITPIAVLGAVATASTVVTVWQARTGEAARDRELFTCSDYQEKIDNLTKADHDEHGTHARLREQLEHELERRLERMQARRRASTRPAWQVLVSGVTVVLLGCWYVILGLIGWFNLYPTGVIDLPGKPLTRDQTIVNLMIYVLAVVPVAAFGLLALGRRLWRRRRDRLAAVKRIPWRSRQPHAPTDD